MNYELLKEYLEKYQIITNKIYYKLINNHDHDLIDNLLIQYINDEESKTKDYYNNIKTFVENEILKKSKENEINSYEYNLSSKRITNEEEVLYTNKMNESLNEMNKYSFNITEFEKLLIEIGYQPKCFDNNDLKLQSEYDYFYNYIIQNNLEREYFNTLNGLKSYLEFVKYYNILFEANILLVKHIVLEQYGNNLEIDDLIQEGYIGLDIAIKRYEPIKGCAFSTYAAFWIKNAIQEYIYNSSSTIRYPKQIGIIQRKYQYVSGCLLADKGSYTDADVIEYCREETRKKLINKGISNPSEKLIDEKCIINENSINNMKEKTYTLFSYNVDIKNDNNESFKEDNKLIVDYLRNYDKLEEDVINSIYKEQIIININKCLKTRDRLILSLAYGLDFKEYLTKEEYINIIKDAAKKHKREIDLKEVEMKYYEHCALTKKHTYEAVGQELFVTRQSVEQTLKQKIIPKFESYARTKKLY